MNRRTFVATSLASLCACAAHRSNDRLEMSIVAVSQELDPYVAPNLESAELSWLYADGLIGSDLSRPEVRSLCVRPPLMRTFGSAGHASFDYELRSGVRWHDGKPLVARDVADCFNRVRASTWGHQRPFSLVTHIDIWDQSHFTVHLTEADRRFPLAFFTPFGSPGIPLVRPGRQPIGTGPFKMAARTPDAASFERWDGSPRGSSRISSARLRYLANGDTQNVMLFSGDTDVALFVPHDEVIRRGFPYFRRRSGVAWLVLNSRGRLSTPQQRGAFAAAIDRNVIVQKIYRGWSPVYNTVVAPDAVEPEVDVAHSYAPGYAKAILAKNEAPIELAAYTDAQPIALLVQDQLARSGIRSTIRTYPVQEFLAPSGPLRSGKFDVALFGEYFSLDPDLEASWGCGSIPPAGGNFSRLCDRRLDAMASAGNLRGALESLRRDAVVVPLVRSVQCIGLSKRLRGARDPGDLVPSVFECAEWWIA
ncbi:MAG TPA: ABC transporter substrate-binding protein [Candidatus Baltobacteraceae bacterium]|nr:ABC transporter substrate-binding protein [Candidatus Baltobacteraceae bacterium]